MVFHVELAALAMGNEGDGQTGMTNEVADEKMTTAKLPIQTKLENWHRTQEATRERRNPSERESIEESL